MIEVNNISFAYKKESKVLDDFSLKISKGEKLAIIGPSGCGKSTILSLIANHIKPTKGSINYNQEIHLQGRKRNVATVFQEDLLFPHLNVFENIAYGLRVRKYSEQDTKNNVYDICALLEITDLIEKKVDELSGGQKQRVSIARTLVIKPEVVLLDEPFSSLDYLLRMSLLYKLQDIKEFNNKTFVYVTHNLEEAYAFGETILVLNSNGNIAQLDKPKTLFDFPNNKFVAEFIGMENIIPKELFSEIYSHSFSNYQKQNIGIRAKHIKITSLGSDAKINKIVYRGSYYDIYITTKNNLSLISQSLVLAEDFMNGSKVDFTIDTSKLVEL